MKTTDFVRPLTEGEKRRREFSALLEQLIVELAEETQVKSRVGIAQSLLETSKLKSAGKLGGIDTDNTEDNTEAETEDNSAIDSFISSAKNIGDNLYVLSPYDDWDNIFGGNTGVEDQSIRDIITTAAEVSSTQDIDGFNSYDAQDIFANRGVVTAVLNADNNEVFFFYAMPTIERNGKVEYSDGGVNELLANGIINQKQYNLLSKIEKAAQKYVNAVEADGSFKAGETVSDKISRAEKTFFKLMDISSPVMGSDSNHQPWHAKMKADIAAGNEEDRAQYAKYLAGEMSPDDKNYESYKNMDERKKARELRRATRRAARGKR